MIHPKPKPEKKSKKNRFAKKPKRKPANAELKKYEAEADRIVKMIVMIRDDAACICLPPENGHSSVMQAGHLVTRGKKSVRWDLWNVHIQCSSCNLLHEHYPERFTKQFILEYGSHRYMELVERASKVRKIPVHEMKQLCAGLNSCLVGLQLMRDDGKLDFESKKQFFLTQDEIINIGRIAVPDL